VPRADLPYPLPPDGAPIRLAFVGQRTYFEQTAMAEPTAGVQPRFVDYRSGADPAPMLDELAAFDPHAVVCFRPESLPAGALADVRAPVAGVLTEPLPRAGRTSHPDLDYNLAELRRADRDNVDRVICVDALGWEAASELLPTWRCMPLPVADWAYRAPQPSQHPPRMVFIGHSSIHRETALVGLKHEFDLVHYAHALMGEDLRHVLEQADVGLVVHGGEWLVHFESQVLLHLAAGHLVISEPLEPTYGLEPGLDYVEVANRYELDLRVHQLHQRPDAYDRVRIRGHHKSRQHRASHVWPRLVRDLFEDLATFGTERRVVAAAR
jgi:hypothetical protein